MAKIKADVAALRANKADIDKKIAELNSLNRRLEQLLTDIESTWKGAASTQYIATMRRHKTKAEQMVNVLSEFRNYIDKAATRFEQKDKEGASRIKGC